MRKTPRQETKGQPTGSSSTTGQSTNSADEPENHDHGTSGENSNGVEQKIRPRPIDHSAPLVIFFPETEDEIAGYYLREDGYAVHKKPQLLRGHDVFVPIPVFKEVDNGDRAPSQFDRPKQYIKEPKPATPDFYGVIEYDLDDDDADFIEGLNDVIASSKKKRKRISEGDFEAYMDFFEKEHFFKQKSPAALPVIFQNGHLPVDPTIHVCDVCNSDQTGKNNALIWCSSCHTVVHQQCYAIGNLKQPTAWKCDKCASPNPTSVTCLICPVKSGAFKCSSAGWCHVACREACLPIIQRLEKNAKAALAPPPQPERSKKGKGSSSKRETASSTARKPKPVDPKKLAKQHEEEEKAFSIKPGVRCCLCNRMHGCCVKCTAKSCDRLYHVTCAMQYGLHVTRDPKETRPFTTLCRQHSMTSSEYLANKSHVIVHRAISDSARQKIVDSISKYKKLPPLDAEIVELVFRYWLMKRDTTGCELIARLQDLAQEQAKLDEHAQKIRKMENDRNRMLRLRQNFERLRLLVDLCKRREILKRQTLDVMNEELDAMVTIRDSRLGGSRTAKRKEPPSSTKAAGNSTPSKVAKKEDRATPGSTAPLQSPKKPAQSAPMTTTKPNPLTLLRGPLPARSGKKSSAPPTPTRPERSPTKTDKSRPPASPQRAKPNVQLRERPQSPVKPKAQS